MSFELKDVYSSVGIPTFETRADFELAMALARMAPGNVGGDSWSGGYTAMVSEGETHLGTYSRLYPDGAKKLMEMRAAGGDGLLVVSYKKEWAVPEAVYIQGEHAEPLVPGPDEELVNLAGFGWVLRKKVAKPGGLTTADVEEIAARVSEHKIRAALVGLGLIVK